MCWCNGVQGSRIWFICVVARASFAMEDRGVEGDEGVHLPPPPQLREEVVPRRAPPGYGGGGSSSTSGPSRAGGSSSSGLFRASGSRGSGSTGQAAALAVQRSTVHIPPLARRPEYGRLGSSTLLLVNYFRFKLLKADDVYHYNVSLSLSEEQFLGSALLRALLLVLNWLLML